MVIILPTRLTYRSLRSLMRQNYESSIAGDVSICSFDWQKTEVATLPEIVALLSWSSKLTGLGKRVTWVFRDTSSITEEMPSVVQAAFDTVGKELFEHLTLRIGQLRQKAR